MPLHAKDKMYWVSTRDMACDALTKSMRWDAIRNVCISESARRALPTAVEGTAPISRNDHEQSIVDVKLMTVCTALMDHFFGLADLAQIRRLELRQKCASVLHLASLGTLVHSNMSI